LYKLSIIHLNLFFFFFFFFFFFSFLETSESIFRIGSTEPGAILFDAYEQFVVSKTIKKHHKYIYIYIYILRIFYKNNEISLY